MITVRDYFTSESRWLVWQASTLQSAYNDYPYAEPPVAELAGRVHVTTDPRDVALAGTSAAIARSVWRLEDFDDYVPGFHLEGHTGLWGIDIHVPAPGESSLRGLEADGDDLVPDPEDRVIMTLNLVDIYPLSDGLPDTFWLSQNDTDIALNP